jgi:hypothetical protein
MITTSKQHPEDPIDTIVYSDATDANAIAEDLCRVIKKFEYFRRTHEHEGKTETTRTSENFLLTVNAKQGNISISGYYTQEADYDGRKFSIMFELPNLVKAAQNQASEDDASGTQYIEEVLRKALTELVERLMMWFENETSKGIEYDFYDHYIIYYRFDAASEPMRIFSSLYDDD